MESLRRDDPERIGGYRLLGRLGVGGMGTVFLGRSPGGRHVAVKLISPEHADNLQFRERFAREVRAARQLGGHHTAQLIDADTEADPPWMVTTYIPGPSLREAVAEHGPLTADRVRGLGAALAEGLAAIHACGLVHRDLKPSNVILAADGPRIIDFGIARRVGATTMTEIGAVLGTVAYMSPEQVLGQRIGPESDLFSLGSVLTFAATGCVPFEAESIPAIIHRITTQPPDLYGLPAQDDQLAEVITDCLAKAPTDRPTPADVLAGLTGPRSRTRPRPTHVDTGAPPPEVRAGRAVTTKKISTRELLERTRHEPAHRGVQHTDRPVGAKIRRRTILLAGLGAAAAAGVAIALRPRTPPAPQAQGSPRPPARPPAHPTATYASLTEALNNNGISDDANPGAGNLDGGGYSYSAQAFARRGIEPGADIEHDGLTYTWPNATPGTPDNVVAGGQSFALSGSGTKLGLVGTGDYGTALGTGIITYADGTTQPFTIGFADWWANDPEPGSDIFATVDYINNPNGRRSGAVSLYAASVPLRPGKTVRHVTLPDFGDGVTVGQTAMHIFAAAIG